MEQVNESTPPPHEIPIDKIEPELELSSVIFAILAGIFLIVFFIVVRRKVSGRNDFLLTGLSESGKSAIFMQLLHHKFPDSFTSITENIGEYRSGRLSGRLVDIPGHYRVRDKCFEQYKRTAKGVIFVVDSATAQKEIRDVADALYTILSEPCTMCCPFLVLCNKQDLTTAKSAQVIKAVLEKEINLVRDTRSRKLQSVGDDDGSSKPIYLGREGKDFEFSHVQQNVQFFECSAKLNELNNLSDWIDRML